MPVGNNAFTRYIDNGDGTFSFQDSSGLSTPPMAGPAALQQKNKIDAAASLAPPPMPVGGAQLSPELLQAGAAGPDLRTANNEHTAAPNGSVVDAGGLTPEQQQLDKLMRNGMSAREAQDYVKQNKAFGESVSGIKNWVSGVVHSGDKAAQEKQNAERASVGLPPIAPKPQGKEFVASAPGHESHGEGHAPAPKVVMAGGGKSGGLSMPTVIQGGGAAGPTQRVEMQTGRQVHEQTTAHSDEDIVANKQAGQAQYNAVEDMALAEEAANNSIAQEKEQALNRIQDAAQKQQAREQLRQEEAGRRMQEIDTLRGQVNSRIDPKQYWSDKTEGEKIGAALLMGIGVMAGHQEPMRIFDQAVERNIDAQKANISAARGKLEDAKGAMAEYMKMGASEKEAEHLTRSLLLDDATRRLDLIATQTNNPKIKANAEARKAEIMKANAQENLKLNETIVGQTKNYAVGTVGGSGAGPQYVYDDVKKEEQVLGPDGKRYEFGEGATAQKAAERLTEINQNKQDADKLQAIIENPSYIVDADKRAEANAIASRLAIHAGKAEGSTGRINEGYFKAVGQAITNGDVNGLTNLGKAAALREYRSGLDTEGMGIIQQHGISQVKPFRVINSQTGKAEIKWVRMGNVPKQAPDMRGTQVGE